MKAYEEQMNMLERLKLKFCNSVYNHLKNAIGHAVSLFFNLCYYINYII